MTTLSPQSAKERLIALVHSSSIQSIDCPKRRYSRQDIMQAIDRAIQALDEEILSEDDLK
jgi:hypothetical protein